MTFKLCSLMLALLMLVVPIFAQVDEKQQARADAERDAEKYVSSHGVQWALHAVVLELPIFTSQHQRYP